MYEAIFLRHRNNAGILIVSVLLTTGTVIPRHKFVQLCDFVVSNAVQIVSQPCLGINAVQLGGFDQGEGDCHGFTCTL